MVYKSVKVLLKTMKWAFIVFLVYIASLFFREQHISGKWIENVVSAKLPENIVFRCGEASFGFRNGVSIREVKIYDSTKSNNTEAVMSFSRASVDPISRRIVVDDVLYPRLPDSYYSDVCEDRNEPVNVTMVNAGEWKVTLNRPKILGVVAEKVTTRLSLTEKRIDLDDIRLEWPDRDYPMSLGGFFYIHFDEDQRLWGEVRGLVMQRNIRPLLVILDIPTVVSYVDAFTEVREPIPAAYSWDVNLIRNDFDMKLDVRPTLGRYNGVAMGRAEGHLETSVRVENNKCSSHTAIDIVRATDVQGRTFRGKLNVDYCDGKTVLGIDAESGLKLNDVLNVIDFLNDGTLDPLVCKEAPYVVAKGSVGCAPSLRNRNDLSGRIRIDGGSLYGINFNSATCNLRFRSDEVELDEVKAYGSRGGRVSGDCRIRIPDFVPSNTVFETTLEYNNGSVTEFGEMLGFDFGDRSGKMRAAISLSGPLGVENPQTMLKGSGSVHVTDGNLAQMKLFAGLTKLLADKVPGVAAIVTESAASGSFRIDNGKFLSDDIVIEGSLFSIRASGAYDFVNDKLDFLVRMQFLKKDSILGRLTSPITWTFSKLLFEVRVMGSLDNPEWDYVSVVDRMSDLNKEAK